jgi:sec-independent protein translocase protein TatA
MVSAIFGRLNGVARVASLKGSLVMGFGSWWHWVILLVVVLVLFGGKGKVSDLMGDVAKGIKSFKKGLADEPADVGGDVKALGEQAEQSTKPAAEKAKS